jgi:hypothetical protein
VGCCNFALLPHSDALQSSLDLPPCCLGGGLPHPGHRVRDRLLAARVMTLSKVKLRPENLFSTTKIICIGENLGVSGAIRSLAAAFYVSDTQCDYAVGPTPQRRGPRQSSRCARARRRPIISAAATPPARALFLPKRSFRCQRKKCASIVVSIWWCQPGYLRTS